MGPCVSVLMPVRDAAAHVGDAVASLRAQTLRDVELVLVDDGSADDSVARARCAWGAAPGLVVLAPGRVGLPRALQVGLSVCRAPLVARMDADDVAHPERLERQAALLVAQPDVAIAGCRVTTSGAGEGYRLYDDWQNGLLAHDDIVREMFIESPLSHPSVMFRAAAVRALGGYRELPWAEDYDLWLRAREAGLRFAKLPEVLLEGRDRPGRTSRIDPRYGLEAMRRCKAHFLARGPLRGEGAVVVWGSGRIGKRLARALEGEGVWTDAFVDVDPRKVGRRRRGAPIVEASALTAHRGAFLLAAVGIRGARDIIRPQAAALGWREGLDFLCVA